MFSAYSYGMTSYEPSSSVDRKVDSDVTESNNITRVLLIQFETDAFEKGGSLENRGMDNGPGESSQRERLILFHFGSTLTAT